MRVLLFVWKDGVIDWFGSLAASLGALGHEATLALHPRSRGSVRFGGSVVRPQPLHDVLATRRPHCVVLWNGDLPHDDLVQAGCRSRGIPILFCEMGWFPQAETLYFDWSGVNGSSSIRDARLPRLSDEQRRALLAFLGTHHARMTGPASPGIEPGGFILVPLQLEQAEAAQKPLVRRMTKILDEIDPEGIFRSIPGVGPIVASYILASVGDIDRFPSVDRFVGYTGYYPVVVQSVDDPRGVRIAKGGPNLLKVGLFMAAEVARKWDPELAQVYHVQAVDRGKSHLTAICHVVRHLAARVYAVLKRMKAAKNGVTPYEYRDPREDTRPALPRVQALQLTAEINDRTKANKAARKRGSKPAPRPTDDGQRTAPKVGRRRVPTARSVADGLTARLLSRVDASRHDSDASRHSDHGLETMETILRRLLEPSGCRA